MLLRSYTGRRCSTRRRSRTRPAYDVWLKAEVFQRTGSYKVRGPSNKLPQLSQEEQRAGVICSSAGNHAQGVAIRRRAARDSGDRPDGEQCDAREDRGHEELRRRGHPPRHDLGRGERRGDAPQGRARPDVHPPVRRPAADRGAGNASGSRSSRTRPMRNGRRPDRRRRADLGYRRRDQGAAAGRQRSSASSRRARPR